MKKTLLSLAFLLCLALVSNSQTTYYWRGAAGSAATGTAWATATNWTINSDGSSDGTGRVTPASNDILIFDGATIATQPATNASKTVYVNVIKDACGSLIIKNGAIVYFTSFTGGTSDVVATTGNYTIGAAYGTVTVPVTGTGTTFTTSLRVGDIVSTTGTTTASLAQVASITDDLSMTCVSEVGFSGGTGLYRIPTLTINSNFTIDATSILHFGFTSSSGSSILFCIYLASTATGSINGQIFFQRNGSLTKIIAVTPGSLVFQNGSSCTIQTNPGAVTSLTNAGPFFGSALGTGFAGGATPNFVFNSSSAGVTFASGSSYIVNTIYRHVTPFGRATQATTPLTYSGAVSFASGSNFNMTSSVAFYNGLPYFYNNTNSIYGNLNWNCAGLPNGGSPAGINLTFGRVDNLTIGSTMTTNYTGSATGTLNLYGNFTNNSTTTNTYGTLNILGSSAQSISGAGTVNFNNIAITNPISLTVSTTNNCGIVNTLSFGNVNNSTLNTGGLLTLKSNSTTTAKLADITNGGVNTGNAISGNVTVETFIPSGKRAYRFLGHPFNTAQSMSSLTDDIFVTGDGTDVGTGGSTGTGLDATGSNAASSWWFDNTTNAWKAFATASDASWTQYAGARVMVRGDRTQTATLTGGADVPNAVTLDMTGAINTGNQNISLPTAGNYHFVSNPYPSPTDIGTVIDALGTGVLGTQYWVWDPRSATRGAYVPKTVGGGAYSIPMSSAFIVQPISSTTLAFTEANKTASATAGNSYFRTNSKGNMQMQLLYNDYPADYFTLNLNEKSAVNKDEKDGEKLMNSDMNFYSYTTDGKKLSLDTRPLDKEDVVKLGISTNVKTSYKIKVASFGIENTEVYLKDNYTNSITKLEAGVEYSFEVTTEAASQGANRFELVMKASPVVLPSSTLEVKMSPNPVKDVLTVSYSNPIEAVATVRIINSKGQILQTQSLGNTAVGTQSISMAKYGKGVYTVELTIGKERISKQVVKN